MGKMTHDLDLLDKALFSFLLTVGGLFGEGLDCVPGLILVLLDKVYGCEIPFSNFLKSLELFMESLWLSLFFRAVLQESKSLSVAS